METATQGTSAREAATAARSAVSCVVATGCDFLALAALVELVRCPLAGATVTAATLGAFVNYTLQRYVAFRARGERKRRQLPRYLVVAATTLGVSSVLTVLLAEVGAIHYVAARALASVITFVVWHYPLARLMVFRRGARRAPRRIEERAREQGGAMRTDRPELTVIVPAYNEAERLPKTLLDMDRTLAGGRWTYEILVVDDGSADATAEVVRQLQSDVARLRVHRYTRNRGKGYAVKTGVMEARGRYVLFTDADNSVPLSEAPKLIDRLDEGASAAIGSRYAPGADVTRPQPWYRVAWSRLSNFVVRRALLPGVRDTQCGFKAFRADAARAAFSQLTVERWGFDLEILALLDRLGHEVVEVPVSWQDDRRTKVHPVRDLFRIVGDFLKVQRNLLLHRYDLSSTRPLPDHG